MPLDCLSQGWPWTLAPLWFLVLMSCLHEGQVRGRMTNRYLLLISFVVKRPLNRDCLAEIVLHEMQLKQDSQANPAEEHISPGSPGLLRKRQSPTPEISAPSANPSALCPEHGNGLWWVFLRSHEKIERSSQEGPELAFVAYSFPHLQIFTDQQLCKC